MVFGLKTQIGTVFILIGILSSCVGRPNRPCSDGGEPSREAPFRGDKTCEQHKDAQGKWVNEGVYREYYENGSRALEGSFKEGVKDGTWTEWSASGKKTRERYFVSGTEVKGRTSVEPLHPENQ